MKTKTNSINFTILTYLARIPVNVQDSASGKNLKLGLCNVQSIKNKQDHLFSEILLHSLDICVFTETWLSDSDKDTLWTKSTILNTDKFQISTTNRLDKRGGGLVIIWNKNNLKCRLVQSGRKSTLEFAIWKVSGHNKNLHIVAIYHQPSNKKGLGNTVFCDEFTELVDACCMEFDNIIYFGDFNILVNSTENPDASQFLDFIEALGLSNHVNFQTHTKGNTLDLILTECLSGFSVLKIQPGTFISDHKMIIADLDFKFDRSPQNVIECRKFKDFNIEDFINDLKFDQLSYDNKDLDQIITYIENVICASLDKFAPKRRIPPGAKTAKAWYNSELRAQRKTVRNRQSIYLKYKNDYLWTAYKIERNKYTAMLCKAKSEFILQDITNNKLSVKNLYKVVNKYTGSEVENPMPDCADDQTLSERFADFFINKIRDNLDQHPKFTPDKTNLQSPLTCFREMSSDEIIKIIQDMHTKSCESDILPMRIIKSRLNLSQGYS